MAAAEKLDLYKQHKDQYVRAKSPVLVKIPKVPYIAIVGRGAPGSTAFQDKIGALYGMAYTLKFTSKFAGRDYKVCGLEGLWWGPSEDTTEGINDLPKDQWNWKLMIRVPDFTNKKDINAARAQLVEKGKGTEVDNVKLESFVEGKCVQLLHVGPYDAEEESIALMQEFAESQGLTYRGLHHELYLSDPRRVPPGRLKTILRQPVG